MLTVLFVAVFIITALFSVFALGVYRYLPHHLVFVCQRAAYYLFGQEQIDWPSAQRAGTTAFSAFKSGVGM